MSPISLLFAAACLFFVASAEPIEDGQDVGTVNKVGNKVLVTGQRLFPYVVHISIRKGETSRLCSGVIVGPNTVLTAAHCLPKNPEHSNIIVHAGIVDIQLEKKAGQRRHVADTLVHKGYKEECVVGKIRCCFGVNDLAILWVKKDFDFGPTVQKAHLYKKEERPYGKQGWILGWGLDSYGKTPSMIQKGQVKIVQPAVCEKFYPQAYLTGTVICLAPVNANKKVKYSLGDAGGPFVSDGIVYGLSSTTTTEKACSTNTLDLVTFVGKYYKWINENIVGGPPRQRFQG